MLLGLRTTKATISDYVKATGRRSEIATEKEGRVYSSCRTHTLLIEPLQPKAAGSGVLLGEKMTILLVRHEAGKR
jgi:hypothetical protein